MNIACNTEKYLRLSKKQDRAKKGQFFTDSATAAYMTDQFTFADNSDIRVLDMGAGIGILSLQFVYAAIAHHVRSINLVAAENDEEVLPYLRETLNECSMICQQKNVGFKWQIIDENYLLYEDTRRYDFAISNPPYRKIEKSDPNAQKFSRYVHGQPNLYTLFMVKGIQQLKSNGQFVYITPRSWTSGPYYTLCRKYLLKATAIDAITLFDSRAKAFHTEPILQETMIIHGHKHGRRKITTHENVRVTIMHDYRLVSEFEYCTKMDHLINGDDCKICIPCSQIQIDALKTMALRTKTLSDCGYIFKTGPVVEYRNTQFISPRPLNGYVPMVRGTNIQNNKLVFPIQTAKAQYVSSNAANLLIGNTGTVFVRRLSAKEDSHRIQCCPYYGGFETKQFSVENHVNYLCSADNHTLSAQEINSIYEKLNSEEYDQYMRMINGSTQINASDLNTLPWES